MYNILDRTFDYLHAQTLQSFITMFWFIVIFEFPRFVLGGIVGLYTIFRYFVKKEAIVPLPDEPIPISVLIPVHNDGKTIQPTILTLTEQIGVKTQIIVINDGSTDDTDLHCQNLKAKGLIDEYIKVGVRGGKASALNMGLRKAKYEYVLATDGDTTFFRDAIIQAFQYFKDPNVAAVCGNLRIRNVLSSLATRMAQLNFVPSISIGRIVEDLMGFYFVVSGAFGLYRVKAIKSVGGWNYGPGDDGDMSVQLRMADWKFISLAIGTTDAPTTFSRLARQRMRWFRSMIRVRYRKFRWSVLNSTNKNFDFWRAFSFYETYFIQAIVPLLFIAFIVMLFFQYGLFALVAILAVHLVYATMYFCEYMLYLCISKDRKTDLKLIIYIPFYSLFHSYFLRMISLYSSFNELIHRGSYEDEFYPKKVRERVKKF
ncbi:MAG: glycosyltransferase family 2 protein [Gammaproteobacteria bacterium]